MGGVPVTRSWLACSSGELGFQIQVLFTLAISLDVGYLVDPSFKLLSCLVFGALVAEL
jgi:hypothetical protein